MSDFRAFNENDVNRDASGKFAAKTSGEPDDINLTNASGSLDTSPVLSDADVNAYLERYAAKFGVAAAKHEGNRLDGRGSDVARVYAAASNMGEPISMHDAAYLASHGFATTQHQVNRAMKQGLVPRSRGSFEVYAENMDAIEAYNADGKHQFHDIRNKDIQYALVNNDVSSDEIVDVITSHDDEHERNVALIAMHDPKAAERYDDGVRMGLDDEAIRSRHELNDLAALRAAAPGTSPVDLANKGHDAGSVKAYGVKLAKSARREHLDKLSQNMLPETMRQLSLAGVDSSDMLAYNEAGIRTREQASDYRNATARLSYTERVRSLRHQVPTHVLKEYTGVLDTAEDVENIKAVHDAGFTPRMFDERLKGLPRDRVRDRVSRSHSMAHIARHNLDADTIRAGVESGLALDEIKPNNG